MKWTLSVLVVIYSFTNTFARDIFVGGAGASDNNPGTETQPFATIQKAASVAVAGDVIKIRSGTYRETIIPANSGTGAAPITFEPDNGATVVVNGTNQVTTPWTIHNGNIYKTSVTLPVNGHQSRLTTNTTLLSNQLFKDGRMQFEARWPDISSEADLLNLTKFRHISQMVNFNPTSLQDNSVPSGMAGAKLVCHGWFWPTTRIVSSQSGSTLTYPDIHSGNYRYRKWYYLTGKLSLLNTAKEWHYENGTLYFYQEGGGPPSGVEYKARNWAFDLRGKSNITIKGLQFFACEPVTTDANSANTIVDNIRAKHMNHSVMMDINEFPGYGNAKQTGVKLIGPNSVIKNSELQYAASNCIWLGERGRAENNLIRDVGYEGSWGAGVNIWGTTENQVITKNTISRTGRSCVDLGFNYIPRGVARNRNVEISYNDMSMWGMLNIDLGAVYAWGFRDMTGSSIHHNWFHDAGVVPDPTGAALDGGQRATYFDQASGPFTVHHNVYWNNFANLKNANSNAADHYTQPLFEHRNTGPSYIYNNTFASQTSNSYITYIASPHDVQRNNIYRGRLNINWNRNTTGNTANSLFEGTNPQFVGSGQGGLAFRLNAGSPAINSGITIQGITDGSVGAPDIGAYEYGGTAWVPGYTAVPQTTPTNTPPVVSITAPANNASFAQGAPIAISANASDANGSVSRVEFFDGTTKLGEDTSSPYTFTWNNATAGAHSVTARATDNSNATTTSTAINITVTANTAPTVAITAPANNARVTVGTSISITATAADANGTVTKVEFFNGTTKLGEDLSSPYSFAWTNAAVGTHTLTARATDNQNNPTTSTAVTVTVSAAAVNTPPTVSITSPANGSQLTSGPAITITANAADANGSVSKVEFFDGTTKLGEDLTSPYSFTWNNAAAGTHALTARATDNQNGVTTSATVNITILNANSAPTVSITGPANNAQFTEGGTITITVNASDSNGSVTKVEFYNGTTKLGEDVTNAYSFTWADVPPGVYIITAKATDNQNNITTSSAVTIVVGNVNIPPTVSITEPLENSELTSGSSISIVATAADADGSVTKVEFFDGTTKLGEDLTAPYTYIWNNVPEGSYSLHAVATDNENGTATSEPRSISVLNDVENPVAGSPEDLYSTIPRFFTPNDDGTGDYWEWTQPELFANSLLSVFNRSGQKIYETLSYNNTWDGKMDGQPLQPGDYYYVIKMPDLTDLKGSVRIIR